MRRRRSSRKNGHARMTPPDVCQGGGSRAKPMPTAAAMSATTLTAAAAVSDSDRNSGDSCDDGGGTSNSSTGGVPPLRDTAFNGATPGSAWAGGPLAVALLKNTRADNVRHGWYGQQQRQQHPWGVCQCPATLAYGQPPVGFEPTTSRLLSGCSAS